MPDEKESLFQYKSMLVDKESENETKDESTAKNQDDASRNDIFAISQNQDKIIKDGDYTFNKCNSPEFMNESSAVTNSRKIMNTSNNNPDYELDLKQLRNFNASQMTSQ